jgi:hypothetical protein
MIQGSFVILTPLRKGKWQKWNGFKAVSLNETKEILWAESGLKSAKSLIRSKSCPFNVWISSKTVESLID